MSKEIEESHRQFVKGIVASGEIWGLNSADGWATSCSDEDEEIVVLPFWSSKAKATAIAKDEWAGYTPEEIELTEFMDQWIFGMAEDGAMIGTNWDEEMTGHEILPLDLALEIVEEIRSSKKEVIFPEEFTLEDYEQVVRDVMSGDYDEEEEGEE